MIAPEFLPIRFPLDAEEQRRLLISLSIAKHYGLNRAVKRMTNRLLVHNVRLVTMVLNRYSHRTDISPEDLFQEGCLFLRLAIEKFDPKFGFKLSTYAVPAIQRGIQHYIAREHTVRQPMRSNNIEDYADRLEGPVIEPKDNKILDKLRRSIRRLPTRQRVAVESFYGIGGKDRSIKDVAGDMGITRQGEWFHRTQGMKALRKMMGVDENID